MTKSFQSNLFYGLISKVLILVGYIMQNSKHWNLKFWQYFKFMMQKLDHTFCICRRSPAAKNYNRLVLSLTAFSYWDISQGWSSRSDTFETFVKAGLRSSWKYLPLVTQCFFSCWIITASIHFQFYLQQGSTGRCHFHRYISDEALEVIITISNMISADE